MKRSALLAWLWSLWCLVGCATLPSAADRYLEEPRSAPDSAYVERVPFFAQKSRQCGPTSAAMVLAWAGRPVPVETLGRMMFTPSRDGTLQLDLLGAARREGFLAFPLTGFTPLFKEVAAGHPVLVFQNLGFSWFPVWHYAVVIGYDLARRKVVLHSDQDANLTVDLDDFERDWAGADYWAALLLPPDRLSASADEIDHLQAAALIEKLGRLRDAETAYAAILSRWPKSLGALIGLGNVRYARGDATGAVAALRRATLAHPRSYQAWHNLAIAYQAAQRLPRARRSARQAVSLAPPAEMAAYRERLGALLN